MAEEQKKEQSSTPPKVDRFQGLSKDLANEIQEYEILYFKEDLPVPFGKLNIYPATVRDYEKFTLSSSCLTFNKNETPEGIRMTNLDFLITKLTDPKEGPKWSYQLHSLLETVFHIKNGLKCKKCGHVIEYQSKEFVDFVKKIQEIAALPKGQLPGKEDLPHLTCPECGNQDDTQYVEMVRTVKNDKNHYDLYVDEQLITSNDFNRLKQIILFQNFVDYRDDSWVDPDIKKDYESRLELEAKKSNHAAASLERKIVALSVTTNYKLSEIYDMTIRKFTMALGLVDDLINYKIMRSAMMSGFVSFGKDFKLEHWLYKTEKDMYGDSYKTTDQAIDEAKNT